MTKPKPNSVAVKRTNGHLVCNTCRFSVPYSGMPDGAEDNRPKHRCVNGIRDFDTFTLKEPRRPIL